MKLTNLYLNARPDIGIKFSLTWTPNKLEKLIGIHQKIEHYYSRRGDYWLRHDGHFDSRLNIRLTRSYDIAMLKKALGEDVT